MILTESLAFFAGVLTGILPAWFLTAHFLKKRLLFRAEQAERSSASHEAAEVELRGQVQQLRIELDTVRKNLDQEKEGRITAETKRSESLSRMEEEKKLLEEAKTRLTDTFKALAGDTLHTSTTVFLRQAAETFEKILSEARGDLGKRQEAISGLVKPLGDSLKTFEEHVRSMEMSRQEAYSGLSEHIKTLSQNSQNLHKETANLVTALRKPHVRGRWGEMTLRRVAELSGMSGHCDFSEQVTAGSNEEGKFRPDMIVHMPAGRDIIVDAKVPLEAYLDAVAAATDEERAASAQRHVRQVREHMAGLSDKRYWNQFTTAPEFVVMFIPGESFFASAVDADPALIEDSLKKSVVLATPTTLIAL
ncbi:MAG: DNA recombination protein RmuC, partial [Candidatus Wallbacteria bacterium]|nr:DNA recombination protein RmuC [Candidatus Wallbacteria bacterium]